MSIEVIELWDSGDAQLGESSTRDRTFLCGGTEDEFAAGEAIFAFAGPVYGGLVFDQGRVSRAGVALWRGSITYVTPARKPPKERENPEAKEEYGNGGSSLYSFEITGGTQHITQSLETVGSYHRDDVSEGYFTPTFGGAIGVNGDSIDGTDIVIPQFSFSEEHNFVLSLITKEYKKNLARLVGKVNNATWRGFEAGEVLFMGASGSLRSQEAFSISFKFMASENATELTVGEITGIAKKGWEYLWVRYEERKDEAAHTLVKSPANVFIEKVYRDGDFSQLGIGE